MSTIDWRIPPSTFRWLERAPTDRPVAVLIRHSVRDELPPGKAGYVLPITDTGQALARELGSTLGDRLRGLHSSPLTRCVQTAEALRDGANTSTPILADRLLGDPGAFVVDGDAAWANWEQLGHEGVMDYLVSDSRAPLTGLADPSSAARFLVQHMLSVADGRPGVHVFVTHDSLVTATAAQLLGEPLGREDWPWYLEGAFFWRESGHPVAAYRSVRKTASETALCTLVPRDVVDFARRELAATVGLGGPARFFLAGGAFKSLLTGRPARDLDLWPATDRDRHLLVGALRERQAVRSPPTPFSDAYTLDDRVVEIPHKTEPPTLEGRLARFDLGLSAVGVEHLPGGRLRPVIDPLAVESCRRREVLLLRPLVNWKYALTTLERMRRYAQELDFSVPDSEEAEVWRVFES